MTSRKLDGDSGVSKGSERLSDWLIRRAARKAPVDLAGRLEEEWRADMASRPSYFSRLRFALGCCWATQVIAFERRPARAAATATSGGGSALLALSESHAGSFSGRSGSFLVVVALHIAVFYALFTWVTGPHAPKIPDYIIPKYLPKPIRPDDRPRTDPPKFRREVLDTRLPLPKDVEVAPEPPAPDGGTYGSDTSSRPSQESAPPHVIRRIAGGAGAGFPNVDEYYPSPEVRLAHQGATVVNVCVNPNGKLNSKPSLTQSSGYERLDEAALRLAQAGSGHYRATTEDGQPVSDCYPIKVRFQLKN